MKHIVKLLPVLITLFLFSCGSGAEKNDATDNTSTEAPKSMIEEEADPMKSIGIGPVSSITLNDEIDTELAATGETLFGEKCTACHKPAKRHIGPAPKGILDRRSPEWVMNMILNPEEMILKDPVAKKLLMEFNGAPMANQSLTEDEARSILEYFRTIQ